MTSQITIPRETFDLMKRALEEACGNRCNAEYNPCYAREALSAAKAVSEPKLGVAVGELASPEYDQLRAKVQPTKLQVTLVDNPVHLELAQYKRMFEAACVDLGLINEALGLDPNDGGSEPILDAIAELKAVQPQAQAKPFGWLKQSELTQAKRFGGSVNLWLEKYDCDTPVFSHPQASEPAEKDDPLQGAVDWLLQADGEFFAVATVQRTLRIGYNRAKRLADIARERASAPKATK